MRSREDSSTRHITHIEAEARLLEWARHADDIGPAVYPSASVEGRYREFGAGAASRTNTRSDGPTPLKAMKADRELKLRARVSDCERAVSLMPPRMRNFVAVLYRTSPNGPLTLRVAAEVLGMSKNQVAEHRRMMLSWLCGHLAVGERAA